MFGRRILKMTVLFIVTVVFFVVLSFSFIHTSISAESHIRNFYKEPKNSIDVLMIGASETYADYSPPLAYKQQNYTSYQICFEGAPGSLYRSMLTEGLKTQSPKLVVFEVNGFFFNDDSMATEADLRLWLDSIPMSKNWYDTINEFVPKSERINYYFNILKYHSNWKKPGTLLKRLKNKYRINKEGISLMKSFSTFTMMGTENFKKTNPRTIKPIGEKYLEELLKYCNERGLKNVLFMRAPHYSKLNKKNEKKMIDLIKKYGYDYVNFDNRLKDIGLDFKTDFYNGEHTNVFGMEKFTKYFSKYVVDNYDVKNEHSDEIKNQWKKCVDYTENAFEVLKERTLENEKVKYFEYSDFSEKSRKKCSTRKDIEKKVNKEFLDEEEMLK